MRNQLIIISTHEGWMIMGWFLVYIKTNTSQSPLDESAGLPKRRKKKLIQNNGDRD